MKTKILVIFSLFLTLAAFGSANAADDDLDLEEIHYSKSRTDLYNETWNFGESLDYIHQYYDGKISKKELYRAAIKGMADHLDKHSVFLDEPQFERIKQNTTGEFGGIGIKFNFVDEFLDVLGIIENSPAQKSGLKKGDAIIGIEGTDVKEITKEDVIKKLRGKRGTNVQVTVKSLNGDTRNVILTRDIIITNSVSYGLQEDGIALIELSRFDSHSTQHIQNAWNDLKQSNPKAVIFDLRYNGGGLLSQAVSVSDFWLESGLIVSQKGKAQNEVSFKASPGHDGEKIPLIVLVNEQSASAAEITAAALSQNNRALLLGKKTYGKGSVQKIFSLRNDVGLKLTVARYYTPNGESIQDTGIEPDIIVNMPPVIVHPDGRREIPSDTQLQAAIDHIKTRFQ